MSSFAGIDAMISALYFSPMPSKNSTASSRAITSRATGLVLLRDLGHALLDRREVFRREGALVGEVVVEAVLDHRADRHLRVGEQLLHRIGEQVRGRVADDVEAFGILVGDDRERRRRDRSRCDGIDELAVDLAGERGLGEARADRRGDLADRDRLVEGTTEPSGSRIEIMVVLQSKKSAASRTFS